MSLCLDLNIVTKVTNAIRHAKNVIHTSMLPQLEVLESLDNIVLDKSLLNSLNEKNENTSGFLYTIGKHRTNFHEATVYLGSLELDIFHYLDRITSKFHAIFEQQSIALISSSPLKNGPKLKQQRRIFLIIQLDDI